VITYQIKAGTTDVSVVIRIVDSTDGTPETGVVFNTAGIDLEYRREGAATTDITEATLAALTTSHSDGGFLHIGNGYYRLDLPDAACASGAPGVLVHGTVTGMVVIGCYIQLIVNTPEDVYTRVGAPAGASVSADVAAIQSDTNDIQTRLPAALVSGRIDASVGAMAANVLTATAINADAITAAKIANGAIDAATFAADVDAEILSYLVDDATRIDASALNTLSSHDPGEAIMGATDLGTGAGLTTLATQASVNTIDNLLDTEIGALTTAVADLPTNAELATALGTADDAVLAQIALVKAVTDALPDAGALTSIAQANALATVDTVVDAIKVQTDKFANLPTLTAGGTGGQGFGAP
jgi:hypothetical protein